MTVATYVQPNNTTQNPTVYKGSIDASMAVLASMGQDYAPHQAASPNMTVVVDAGALMNAGSLVVNSQQTTGTITAPVGNPRIDRVVVNQTTGVISVVTGTPSGSPVAPAITAGCMPCCQVLLQTSSSSITNAMITDERTGYAPQVSLGANTFTADQIINGLTIGQGLYQGATQNTALGYNCLSATTSGSLYNVGIGYSVMAGAVAAGNTAVGYDACNSATGSYNTATGAYTLQSNAGANHNTAIGYSALKNCTGAYNTGLGSLAGGTTSGLTGTYNVLVGYSAGSQITSGGSNVGIGANTLVGLNIGNTSSNTAVGAGAGGTLNNSSITIGSTLIGCNAGGSYYTGGANIAIGHAAGASVVLTGSYNTHIGNSYPSGTTVTNEIAICTAATAVAGKGSNTVMIGSSSTTANYAGVTSWTAISDERDKTDITPIPVGLDLIMDLKPVYFTWNARDGGKVGIPAAGFIAQDLIATRDKFNAAQMDFVKDHDPDQFYATPDNLLPALVKAIQELKAEFDAYKLTHP